MNASNSTYDSFCSIKESYESLVEVVFLTVAFLLVTFGISANIFVVVLAARYTARKNLHHLIVNMAMADLLMVITSSSMWFPYLFSYNILEKVELTVATYVCKAVSLIGSSSVLASLLTLLIISVERFRVTRLTVQRSRPYTLKRRIVVLSCSWLFPLVIIGYRSYTARVQSTGHTLLCDYEDGNRSLFYLLYYIFALIILFVSITLNILTLRRLTKPRAIESSLSEAERQARVRRTAKVVKMVMSSLILYALCYIPFYLLNVTIYIDATIFGTNYNCLEWKIMYFVLPFFLPLCNSCFSPCMYIIFLSDFREAASRLVCRRTVSRLAKNRRKSVVEPQQMETVM